jgi:hypothetical protein
MAAVLRTRALPVGTTRPVLDRTAADVKCEELAKVKRVADAGVHCGAAV